MSRARRVWACVAVIVACGALLAGCWDSVDPKTLDIVVGVGFERALPGPGYAVLAQVPTDAFMAGLLPGQGAVSGTQEPSSTTLSASGETVPLALGGLSDTSGKRVYLGQLQALFVDGGLARGGLGDLVEQLFQTPTVSSGVPLVVVDGSLAKLFAADLPGTYMAPRFVTTYFRSADPSILIRVPLWQFLVSLRTPGTSPILPVFRLTRAAGGQTVMAAEGTAVFAGERLALILTGAENQGLLLWRNRFRRQALALNAPRGPVTVGDLEAKTTFREDGWRGGRPEFAVRTRVTGTIHTDPIPADILTPSDVRALQRRLSDRIARQMRQTLRALEAAGDDAIGFGAWLYYSDPRAYARLRPWPRTFAHLHVALDVVASLRTTGWRA